MRTTVMQVNNNIFHHINQNEYAMGLELFFATIVEHIFTFIQIGQPFILIDRPHQYLRNIGHVLAPSLDTPTNKNAASPPLPHQLLGVHEDISLHSFFFRFQPTDHLILLNRNTIPTGWFHLKREERTLDNLSQKAAEDNPLTPFWLAIVQLHTEEF